MRTLRLPLFAVFCAALSCLPWNHTASADARGYTPPHAADARSEPARFPEQQAADRLSALQTRHAVYLGLGRYDVLEFEAAQLMLDYSAKHITADGFIELAASFAPLAGGETDLSQLQAWVDAYPKSYIAWYALGRKYLELTISARGAGANSTGAHEPLDAVAKYAEQASAAFRHSLELSARPLPSLIGLMSVQAFGGPYEVDSTGNQAVGVCNPAGSGRGAVRQSCAKNWHDLQYQILQTIMRIDPDVTAGFSTYFAYNSPRWGGRYPHLREMVGVERQRTRMNPTLLAEVQALELESEASDARDPMRKADLYIQAFDANPRAEHLSRLYRAADAAKHARNLPFALKIYDRIIQVRPTEYVALFERGECAEDEYHDHSRLFADLAESAKLGMKESQNSIGYAYLTGRNGFPVDLQEARRWLTLAANQGNVHSRDKLPVVEELIAEQVRKAPGVKK